MLPPPYLFNQTLQQLRQIGARGGRASGRTRRARRQAVLACQSERLPPAVPTETAAQAIAALDAQFPWLRGAEKRRRSPPRRRALWR